MQTWYETYSDQGLIVLSLITETYDEVPPDVDDLNEWADTYGQTFPVLSDAERVVDRFNEREGVSLPSLSLLGRGAEIILADDEVTESDIIAALADE